MSTWDNIEEKYYSGQGAVLMGPRNSSGLPQGLEYVGNVSALKISIATTVLEHKESHTGQRGTDKRINTETKVTISVTMENYLAKNLAKALRGDAVNIAAASQADLPINLFPGKISGLGFIKVASAVLKQGGTNTLTAWTADNVAWDYKINEASGSVYVNDGSTIATDKLGIVPTNIAVGATTTVTVPSGHGVTAGVTVKLSGVTGADAADMNGLPFTVASVTSTTVVLTFNSTGKTLTTAAGTRMVYDNMPGTASFNNSIQKRVDALTKGVQELFLRFEGLNTADDNAPVVVEVFKFSTDPLKELDLISDGIQQFVLEGSVLADSIRAEGSKYFATYKAD